MRISKVIIVALVLVLGYTGSSKAQLFPQSLKFELGLVYGTISPNDINSLINNINDFTNSSFENLENTRGLTLGIRQAFRSRFGVVLGVSYLVAETNKQTQTLSNPEGQPIGDVDEYFRLVGVPVSLGPEMWFGTNNIKFRIGILGELYFVRFEHRATENSEAGIPEYKSTWSGEALGINGMLSVDLSPFSKYYFGGRIGYRFTNNAELTHDDDRIASRETDLDGFYTSFYIGVAPWN